MGAADMTPRQLRDSANRPWGDSTAPAVGQSYCIKCFGDAKVTKLIGATAEVTRPDGATIYIYASLLGTPGAPLLP